MRSYTDFVRSTRPTLYVPSAMGGGWHVAAGAGVGANDPKDWARPGVAWDKHGSAPSVVGGIPGCPEHHAALFPSGSSYLRMPTDAAFDVTFGATWMTWFIWKGGAQFQQFMDRDAGGGTRCWQWRMNNGRPEIIAQTSGGAKVLTHGTAGSTTRWNLAIATFDSSGVLRVYLNDVFGASSGPHPAMNTGSKDITIADYLGAGTQDFRGVACHWAFWKRTLSRNQLTELWQRGIAARRPSDLLLAGV